MKKENEDARVGLILSICGLVTFGITSILGIIYSAIAYFKSTELKGKGKNEAIAGIIIGNVIIIGIMIFLAKRQERDEYIDSVFDTYEEERSYDDSMDEEDEVEKKEIIYNIGDAVPLNKFEVTIEKVTLKEQVGSKYFNITASDGGIYVCIDYRIKNISDEPKSSFSFPSIKLVDSKNTKYSRDFDATWHYEAEKDNDTKVVSDLNPGISVTDSDVFEISKELYENGSWYVIIDSDKKVKIK